MNIIFSNIRCNECGKRLTEKEASVYPLQWRYSGDMYCRRHRACPDDCRRMPCLLEQEVHQAINNLPPLQDVAWISLTYRPELREAAKQLGRMGEYRGMYWKMVWRSREWWLEVRK